MPVKLPISKMDTVGNPVIYDPILKSLEKQLFLLVYRWKWDILNGFSHIQSMRLSSENFDSDFISIRYNFSLYDFVVSKFIQSETFPLSLIGINGAE